MPKKGKARATLSLQREDLHGLGDKKVGELEFYLLRMGNGDPNPFFKLVAKTTDH